MSIAVITVCDEKVALSDAICGGLPCGGGINSTSRRRTTAIANDAEPEPSESHRGSREGSGDTCCCMLGSALAQGY